MNVGKYAIHGLYMECLGLVHAFREQHLVLVKPLLKRRHPNSSNMKMQRTLPCQVNKRQSLDLNRLDDLIILQTDHVDHNYN